MIVHAIIASFLFFFSVCFYIPEINQDCPTQVPYMEKFDSRKFNGTWYLQQSYYYRPGNFGCVDFEFNWNTEKRAFTVKVNEKSTWDGVIRQYYKKAIQERLNFTNTAKFFAGYLHHWRHFYVIDTDYYNYALVYTCKFIDYDNQSENVYILSRRWDFNVTSSEELLQALDQPFIRTEYFEDMPQVYTCYYSNGNWDTNSTLYKMIATFVMIFGFKNLNLLMLV